MVVMHVVMMKVMHSCHSMSAIVLFSERKIRDRHKREALIEAFRKADKNGDGRLSVDEVRKPWW